MYVFFICRLQLYIFFYAYHIIQRIDMDFRSMRYIHIDYIIIFSYQHKHSPSLLLLAGRECLMLFPGCEGGCCDSAAEPGQHWRDHWSDLEERWEDCGREDHNGGRRTQETLGRHHTGELFTPSRYLIEFFISILLIFFFCGNFNSYFILLLFFKFIIYFYLFYL